MGCQRDRSPDSGVDPTVDGPRLSPELWYQLPSLLACLVSSAFFSGSETALFSLDELELERMRASSARARLAADLAQRPNRTLVTLLLANMVMNVLISVLITSICLTIWGPPGLGVAIPAATVLLVLFGEILPKTLGLRNGRRLATTAAPIVDGLARALGPVREGLERMASAVAGPPRSASLPREELATLLDVAREEGAVTPFERDVLGGILDLATETAGRLMTPRVEVTALSLDATPKEARDRFEESGHSRILVYEDSADQVAGILLLKDLLTHPEATTVRELLREANFVPETLPAPALFREFQRARTHIAVVVGEHGGMEGIVTLEDLLEEIVGDIRDESDSLGIGVEQMLDGSWRTDAAIELDELADVVGIDLSAQTDAVTLSGLLQEELGRVPRAGDRWSGGGLDLRVLTAGPTRAWLVHIRHDAEVS